MQRNQRRGVRSFRGRQQAAQAEIARLSREIAPRQFYSNVELKHTFRFSASSAFQQTVTPIFLAAAAGAICSVTNSTLKTIAGSVKVNFIEVWSPPPSQGAATTCSVDFAGSANNPNREYSDTSVSVTRPAHVLCNPPTQSLCSFWQQASNTTSDLFTIAGGAGAIIDVGLSIVLADGDAEPSSVTVTTATLGNVYYLALDGPTSNLLVPVSLATTH